MRCESLNGVYDSGPKAAGAGQEGSNRQRVQEAQTDSRQVHTSNTELRTYWGGETRTVG